MKNFTQILITAVVAAIVSYGVVNFTKPTATEGKGASATANKLPAKISCGYIVYPPYFMKDPNTGKFSGIFYDLTQKISEEIGIPVEWKVETGFGTATTDVAYRKFDVMCSGLWADPKRGLNAAFSQPALYAPILAYVRSDDTRFDGKTVSDLAKDTQLKIATVDGEFSDIIRKSMFPSSQVLAEPQNTSVSNLGEDVALKKADLTFLEPSVAADYAKNNPGKIKALNLPPLHLGETTWLFNKEDRDLRELFNVAIRKLNGNGFTDMTIKKYETAPGSFYRVAKPYEAIK